MKIAKLNLIGNETEIIDLVSFSFKEFGISKVKFIENGKVALQQDSVTNYFGFKHQGKYSYTIFDIVADIIKSRYHTSGQAKNIISIEYFNQQKTFFTDWCE